MLHLKITSSSHILQIKDCIINKSQRSAAGKSLPELVTSFVAATKRNSDIAIGNVIGSNIFNILLILSISGLVMPIQYNPKFNLDFYILIGGTIFLLAAMITGKRKKNRPLGSCYFTWVLSFLYYIFNHERNIKQVYNSNKLLAYSL